MIDSKKLMQIDQLFFSLTDICNFSKLLDIEPSLSLSFDRLIFAIQSNSKQFENFGIIMFLN